MLSQEEERKISRRALFESVWTSPMTKVAFELGISDRGLGKLCKRFDIPSPYRGYWARVEAGEKLVRPALPPSRYGVEYEIFLPREKPLIELLDDVPSITVPATLRNPHPLTKEMQTTAQKGGLNDWVYGCSGIQVTGRLFPPALRILDALIKEADTRGYSFNFSKSEAHCDIRGGEVEFRIIERTARVRAMERGYETTKYDPRGVLCFEITNCHWEGLQRSWTDGKRLLEDHLGKILLTMELSAKRWVEREERWAREREEDEQRRKIQEEHEARVKRLSSEIKRFEKLLRMKRYLRAVRKKPQADPSWTDWIERYIDYREEKFETRISAPVEAKQTEDSGDNLLVE